MLLPPARAFSRPLDTSTAYDVCGVARSLRARWHRPSPPLSYPCSVPTWLRNMLAVATGESSRVAHMNASMNAGRSELPQLQERGVRQRACGPPCGGGQSVQLPPSCRCSGGGLAAAARGREPSRLWRGARRGRAVYGKLRLLLRLVQRKKGHKRGMQSDDDPKGHLVIVGDRDQQ